MSGDLRTARSARFALSLLAASSLALFTSCVDGPAGPKDGSALPAPFVIAPSFSLVGPDGTPPTSPAQASALANAFDRVDRFRMVVSRNGEVLLDKVFTVTPGQPSYELSVTLDAQPGETLTVQVYAYQGETQLFASPPSSVQAATPTGGTGGTGGQMGGTNVALQYSGPDQAATALTLTPAVAVIGPGGSVKLAVQVTDQDGAPIADVPLSWTTTTPTLVSLALDGTVTGSGEGVAQVTVATPTGLQSQAKVYVVGGEITFVQGGAIKTRALAGGEAQSLSGAVDASQLTWGSDGKLYYVAGGSIVALAGGAVGSGSWPAMSPDGTKFAVSGVTFMNADGSNLTSGPAGDAPLWLDGETLVVGNQGRIQQVKYDGSGRTDLAAGSLPSFGPGGEIAYLGAGGLQLMGGPVIVPGAAGRPAWVGPWVVVNAGGLVVAPADGSAAPVALPGLGDASSPVASGGSSGGGGGPAVSLTGTDPSPPVPGQKLRILGSGFDPLIPTNNRVFFPVANGTVEGVVTAVGKTFIETTMPLAVVTGQIRVEVWTASDILAYTPAVGSLEVKAATPWGTPVSGVTATVKDAGGTQVGSKATDDTGAALFTGLTPGDYTVGFTPPSGFTLSGEATRKATVGAAPISLDVEVTPAIAEVTTSPAALLVGAGSTLDVELSARDARGNEIPQVTSSAWAGGSPEVTAMGTDLKGSITGVFPSASEGSASLTVALNNRFYSFPVTVTSVIEGTVMKESAPVTAPAGVAAEAEAGTPGDSTTVQPVVANTNVPAAGATVVVQRDDTEVARVTTDSDGHYLVPNLFAGTYEVTALSQGDLDPVPATQSVVLGKDHPKGKADILLSGKHVAFLVIHGAATLESIDATLTLSVTAYDDMESVISGLTATWTSLNPTIATVDADGVVTAVANGTATMKVEVGGVTRTVDIVVAQKAVSLVLLKGQDGPPLGTEEQALAPSSETLGWDARDANGHPVPSAFKKPTFSDTPTGVVTITVDGVVTFATAGIVDITATMDGASDAVKIYVLSGSPSDVVVRSATDAAAVASALIGKVNGDLIIDCTLSGGDCPSLTTLTGLESIVDVTGSVFVQNNSALTDMAGLGHLAHVGQDLIVQNNPVLTTAAGPTAALQRVDGSIRIVNNALVTNADNFGNLQSVGGDLEASNNPSLTNLNGLVSLQIIEGGLTLIDNPLLNSTGNLPALTDIKGSVFIDAGAQVFGAPALVAVSGSVDVGSASNNTTLQELRFPMLDCAGTLSVYNNNALSTVDVSSLSFLGSMCGGPPVAPPAFTARVSSLQARADQAAARRMERLERGRENVLARRDALHRASFEARMELKDRQAADVFSRRRQRMARDEEEARTLAAVPSAPPSANGADVWQAFLARRAAHQPPASTADFAATRAPSLTATAPAAVSAPPGSLEIFQNPILGMTGFPALSSVDGDLIVEGNSMLPALDLPLLSGLGGDFDVATNGALSSISAPQLPGATGVFVSNNGTLTSFTASGLTHASWVEISMNDALPLLSLPALQGVEGYLWVYSNHALTQVLVPLIANIGSDPMDTLDDDLVISDQPKLQTLQVASGSMLHVVGQVDVYGNGASGPIATLSLPGLTNTGADLYVGSNTVNGLLNLGTTGPLTIGDDLFLDGNTITGTVSLGGTGPFQVQALDNGDDQIPGISITDNGGLFTVSAPALNFVDGDLLANYNPGLTSLSASGTQGQTVIEGHLTIWNNDHLAGLSAPNVSDVNTGLDLRNNPALTTLTLPGLRHAHDFRLWNNGTLGVPLAPDLSGLQTIDQTLELTNNPGIQTFGPPSLTFVGNNILVDQNPALTGLNLGSVPEANYVEVWDNDALLSFDIHSMTDARGGMDVIGNAALQSFNAHALQRTLPVAPPPAPALVSAPFQNTGDPITIFDNAALTGFDLSSLMSTAGIEIHGNGALTSLPDLGALGDGSSIKVLSNPLLHDLAGLAGVSVLYGVVISGNPVLVDISGMSSLQHVFDLAFDGNDALTSISGLTGLAQVWGKLSVTGNTTLATLDLPVATLGSGAGPDMNYGNLDVMDNPLLVAVNFAGLTVLDGRLSVVNNGALASLGGFTSLASPIYSLGVKNNPVLVDLTGLQGIASAAASPPAIVGSVDISGNATLSDCHVQDVLNAIAGRFDVTWAVAFGSTNVSNVACVVGAPGRPGGN